MGNARSMFVAIAAMINLCASAQHEIKDFSNVYNAFADPSSSWAYTNGLSDQGAWFAMSIPEESNTNALGSFGGPYLVGGTYGGGSGSWISKSMAALVLYDQFGEVTFSSTDKIVESLPGKLHQNFKFTSGNLNGLEVDLELIFASDREALVQAKLTNNSSTSISYKLGWKGNEFSNEMNFKQPTDFIECSKQGREVFAQIKAESNFNGTHLVSGTNFTIEQSNYSNLSAGESFTTHLGISIGFGMNEFNPVLTRLEGSLQNPQDDFTANTNRWQEYLDKVFQYENEYFTEKKYRDLAVKSMMTLISNWISPAEEIKVGGVMPSFTSYFNGLWAWDSWKHAAGIAYFDKDLAEDCIRSMFDRQNAEGMIPDVFYRGGGINWRNTKPPLATWGVFEIYKQHKNVDFLAEMYDQLITYHEWWYTYRDHDQDGLCEYGSTDGSLQAAAWESGMDNAVRFDNTGMEENVPNKAYSMDQESVDLNAYLFQEKILLSKIAKILGKSADAVGLQSEADALKVQIRDKMFDEEKSYFFDIKFDTHETIDGFGPEGWTPLFTNVATCAQAAEVRNSMVDEQKFNTFAPLPTLSSDHPQFDGNGYWRGGLWVDQVYFGIRGLENYGYFSEAELLREKLLKNLEGVLESNAPIRENYLPLTGSAIEVEHFSWSAAHFLMMLMEKGKQGASIVSYSPPNGSVTNQLLNSLTVKYDEEVFAGNCGKIEVFEDAQLIWESILENGVWTPAVSMNDSTLVIELNNPIKDASSYEVKFTQGSIWNSNEFPANEFYSPDTWTFSVDLINGIENIFEHQISVYPNPASNELTIQSDLNINEVRLRDVSGRIVFEQTMNQFQRMISLSLQYAPGTYLLEMNTEMGPVAKNIIIK